MIREVTSWHRFFLRRAYGLLVVSLMWLMLLVACQPDGRAPSDVAFVGWDGNGKTQLFRQTIGTGQPEQLTGQREVARGEVSTFGVSPDGAQIAYSLVLDEGGSEVRRHQLDSKRDSLLLDCPDAECGEFAWAPDGQRLVYERREMRGAAAGVPHLWWLDATTGESVPLIEDAGGPTYGAAFSPDGQWLAYVSPGDGGVVVVNLLDATQRLLPSEIGMPPRWAPDSTSIIVSDQELVVLHGAEGDDHDEHSHDFRAAVHLFLQKMAGDMDPLRLSPDLPVDDSSPAWSPDGQWLVIGRREADTANGRQLWIMRPDGSEARPLTSDPALHYGSVAWSPDGRFLLYQRGPASGAGERPSIWLMDVSSGDQQPVAAASFLPQWIE